MRRILLCLAFAAIVVGLPRPAAAQESVRITVPAGVSFAVTNVNADTASAPANVSYNLAILLPLRRLRISVKADTANFTSPPPASGLIPASKAVWTTSNASGGTGSSGTLSSAAYGVVYESNVLTLSGAVDVNWTLKAPGAGIRAGAHTLAVRYKVESF
jgi:hypothetical protein